MRSWPFGETVAALLLGLLVVLAPLILGSDRLLPWGLNGLAAGLALLAAATAGIVAWRQGDAVQLTPIGVPAVLMLVVVLWIVVQTIPGLLPAHGLWSLAPGAGGAVPLSVDPDQTLMRLQRLLTDIAVFAAAYLVARDARRATRLLALFLIAAVIYAVYGYLRLGLALPKVLWFDIEPSTRLAGPFVNPNHAATYFGLASVVALALALRALRHALGDMHGRRRLARAIEALAGRPGWYLAAFFAVASALILTASRSAIPATLLALLFLLALDVVRGWSRGARSRFAGLLTVVLAAALLLVALQLSGANLAGRVMLDEHLRWPIYRATLAAIGDNWLFGTGYGSFADILPLYRSQEGDLGLLWDTAHSDYLELALGLGLPAAALVLAAFAMLFARTVAGSLTRRHDAHFATVGAAAAVLVGLHALTDFSLQIEGVSIPFAALFGIGVAQARSSRLSS